jgi:hypothetical protein
LVGNLKLSVKLRGTDEYYIHKFLKDVRKITGYLLVFSSTGLKDLSFFKNLVQIDGNDLWNDRYTIALYNNWHLAHLWDKVNDLVVGPDGNTSAAYLQFNPSLCSEDIAKLTKKFNRTTETGNSLTGICSVEPLNLTVHNIREGSVTVKWEPLGANSSRLISGYIVHYVMIGDLAEECTENSEIEPCNWVVSRPSQDFVGWNAIEWNHDMRNGTINNLVANSEYLIHIQSYSIAPHQHLQISNITKFKTRKEAFASEPVKLKIMGCCSQSSNSNNLTVQWGSPLRGNVSIIGYVVELQQLKWDTCNTTNAMPVAAKWFKTQNLTINRDGMETICLPKCVIESDSDQDTSTDDDIGLFQQLANLRYNKKNVSVRQGNIEETNKRISRSINDTSAVITELQPFFAYKVRVRAQTEAGWGPWSSELVAFTAPSYNSDRVVNLSANVIDETRVCCPVDM